MQLPPSIKLSGFIRHYLFLSGENPVMHRLRLFPDGNTGIVFNLSSNLTLDNRSLPEAFIYGQISGYRDIDCHGPAHLFIIVVQPDGFNRLLGVSAKELKDKVVSLTDLLGFGSLALQRAVVASKTTDEKIMHTEAFFGEWLANRAVTPDPLIAASIGMIREHGGLIPIHELAGSLGCHPRQLERHFTTAIGLSPKKFCNIIRAHAFLRHLRSSSRPSNLTGYAYDSGYYDQAHVIREFRQITGLTPSQYRKNTVRLAVNFLGMGV